MPQEHVYPKFDAVARLWESLHSEQHQLTARAVTLTVLQKARSAIILTLSDEAQNFDSSADNQFDPLEEEILAAEVQFFSCCQCM